MTDRTTDFETVRRNASRFTWGAPTQWFGVGPYTILEFHPWKVVGATVRVGEPDTTTKSYHVWVDRRNTSHSFSSLDAALAGAIAYRIEGANHRADFYFMEGLEAAELRRRLVQVQAERDEAVADLLGSS